jgi:hypothetical protein
MQLTHRLRTDVKNVRFLGSLIRHGAAHGLDRQRDLQYASLIPDSAVKKYDIEEAEKKDSGSECLG